MTSLSQEVFSRRLSKLATHLTSSIQISKLETSGIDDYERSIENTRTISQERANSRFNITQMSYAIDGGKENTEFKQRVMREVEAEPVFKSDDQWTLSLEQTRMRTWQKVMKAVELFLSDGNEEIAQSRSWVFEAIDPSLETVIGVHYFLFRPAIEGSGTLEQIRRWVPDTIMYRISGCFAMTEIGTGSNVPGVETTATYDPKTQRFVLHTPTLTATKWWIGGAADLSTHAVVFARLLVPKIINRSENGKDIQYGDLEDHGIQMFVVQLRDLKTHNIMPNITIGDCGEKMGRHGVPNGWIQFNQCPIDRDQLLARFIQVSPEGVVTKRGSAQNAYAALIGGRVVMGARAANTLAHMTTIAVRYGAIRRQFSLKPNEPQIPILNYSTHAKTLMPLISAAYAMHFTARKLTKIYTQAKELAKTKDDFSLLGDVHTLSAGVKPFFTWLTHYGIDECRQSCGGHGYSAYSRFAKTQESWAVMCTWEGSNVVLAQQLSQALVKALQRGLMGKPICNGGEAAEKLTGMAYLRRIPEFLPGNTCDTLHPDSDWRNDVQALLNAWAYIPGKMLITAAELLQEKIGNGMSEREAWNDTTVELVQVSKAHTYLFILESFLEEIDSINVPDVKTALLRLWNLFALYHMEQNLAVLLENGYFSSEQSKQLRKLTHLAIKDVRIDAVAYTDAFGFTDFVIQSPLGRYDGDVYKHYFAEVKAQHPPRERPPWYESLIKPFLSNNMTMPEILVKTLQEYEQDIARENAKLAGNVQKSN